jgi:glycosyltransferase involved in cell wall biosynthesis
VNDEQKEPLMTVKLAFVTTIPMTLGFFRGHIRHLQSRGFKIHVVSSPGAALDEFGRGGVAPHAVDMERAIRPGRDLMSLYQLYRVFRAVRPTLVHAISPKAGLLAPLAARLTNTPAVMLSSFGLPQITKTGALRHLLDATTRASCALADRVWCDSGSMRDYLATAGLCRRDKLIVLGQGSVCGVDADHRFSPARCDATTRGAVRARYGIPAQARVVGFVGRLVRDKGLHELALAWRDLRARSPDLHLLLVGPWESRDPLPPEDEALFRFDPRVHLAGRREDIPEHLAAMDVNVLPSYREGFGVTNIEAAAMSLPVVSTRIPGCVDSVIDGVTGTLVPPRDPAALTAALEAYLGSTELRRLHGNAGRQRVLRAFRPEMLYQALCQAYLQLLRHKGCVVPESQVAARAEVPAA